MSAPLENEAVRQLEAVGFLVQRQVRQKTVGKLEAVIDIVAWAGTPDGELAPELIVEVKSVRNDAERAVAARQLGYYVPLVDAARAYIFDGAWHVVSDDFASTFPADCPRPAAPTSDAVAPWSMLSQLIWSEFDKLRGSLTVDAIWKTILQRLSDPASDVLDAGLFKLATNPTNRARIADVLVSSLDRLDRRSGTAQHFTPPALAAALVRLLAPEPGCVVADPFCGLGRLLAAVHTATAGKCQLIGTDINAEVAESARKLLALAGISAEIRAGDSLGTTSEWIADHVVSNPPMGVRLEKPGQLEAGMVITRDGTLVAVDRALAGLRDGGRAVFLVPPGMLFGDGATEEFRAALLGSVRVVSIIELPPQLLPSTAIRCAVLVLEKAKPTETLVARLEGDWELQLSDNGDFMRDYRAHLEARS